MSEWEYVPRLTPWEPGYAYANPYDDRAYWLCVAQEGNNCRWVVRRHGNLQWNWDAVLGNGVTDHPWKCEFKRRPMTDKEKLEMVRHRLREATGGQER